MFQLINAVSQTAVGAVFLMAIEFAVLFAIVFLAFRGWEKYQEGQHIRAGLRMNIIKSRREEALKNN